MEKMNAANRQRKLLWWNMPISPNDSARVGGGMFQAIAIWFVVLVAVIAALVVIGIVF